MDYLEFSRAMVMNFVGAIVIGIMLWFFLTITHIEYISYLGALVGMYVFAAFGVNRIVDDNLIPNNYSRFILAIVCIIIYGVAFLYIMPMIFGANVFPNPLSFNYGGYDIVLTTEMILAIFGLIVLVANYFDYRQ